MADCAKCRHEHVCLIHEPCGYFESIAISYKDCANAMLKMWIDNVVTDGEYNRIMDRLNKQAKEETDRL